MVTCEQCGKKITDPEDLKILARLGYGIQTFCNSCYWNLGPQWITARAFGTLNTKFFIVRLGLFALVWLLVLMTAIITGQLSHWIVVALIFLGILWLFVGWRKARKTVKMVEAVASGK